MLRRVATGGSAEDIFDALTGVVPFAAGLVDTFTEGATEAGIVVTARMSPDLIDDLMRTRDVDAPQIHPVIGSVPLGRLLVDREARRSLDFEGVGGYGILARWGLGQPCAMSVLRSAGQGARQNTYVALIRERGEPGYSDDEAILVQSLWRDIADAVERARLPLTANEPILHQVIREQRLGLAVVNAAGRVIESNFLAHSLAARYLPRMNVSMRRHALSGFVSAILDMPLRGGAPLVVAGPGGAALLVSVHLLLADAHALRENVRLMLLRELQSHSVTKSESAELQGLPPRLREVAGYLTQTGLGQKQIADLMGISPGTLRKHIERLYREMGVGSRAELAHRTKGTCG